MPEPQTLTWPLRLAPNGTLATVEQDTEADLVSCTIGILATPQGWCDDLPEFGRPRVLFRQGGVNPQEIADSISEWESRVTPSIVAQAIREVSQRVTIDRGERDG